MYTMEALRGACNCSKFLKAPTRGCPLIALHNTTSEQLTANTENSTRYKEPEGRDWDCLDAYFVKEELSISEADGNCGG